MTRIDEYLNAITKGLGGVSASYPSSPAWRIEQVLDAFITYIWEDEDHPRHPCPDPVWHLEEQLRAIYDVFTNANDPTPFPAFAYPDNLTLFLFAIWAFLSDGTEASTPTPSWDIERELLGVLDAIKEAADS